jgi:hypothetical protein
MLQDRQHRLQGLIQCSAQGFFFHDSCCGSSDHKELMVQSEINGVLVGRSALDTEKLRADRQLSAPRIG